MFAYVLHKENTSNQIIYTSTLSSTAFKPLAEQCDSVQKTFLIFRYALQKIIFEAIETCKFHSKILWFFFFFSLDMMSDVQHIRIQKVQC